MPEDTVLYVFRDAEGRWLSSVDEDEARAFVANGLPEQDIAIMTLGELFAIDAHALVRARSQYYWAADLMTGVARGAIT